MQIRDFLEHEWQTVGAVQARLSAVGVRIPELALRRIIQRTVPDAIFDATGTKVRLLPPEV